MARIFYSPDYVLARYDFDTTRKAAPIALSLVARPLAGIELAEPPPADRALVERVHYPFYVRAIRTGEPRSVAESQGFDWDPGLWPMVLSSNGGLVAAAQAAREDGVSGTLSSGMHHARRGSGDGFCTFNGLAMAAYAGSRWPSA